MIPSEQEHFLDLRGVYCPENLVRLQAALDGVAEGQGLELYVDDGEPVRSVSQTLKEDGHRIVGVERREGYFALAVIKKA